jgi:hypothetical protein
MKKNAIIIVIALLLVTGGYFTWSMMTGDKAADEEAQPITPGLSVVADDSLLGWMGRNSVECSVTSPEGVMKIMLKDQKVRIEGIPYAFAADPAQAANGVSLTDGDWVYMWSGGKGTKMNLKKMQETMTPEQKKLSKDYSWQETARDWDTNGLQYSCEEKKLDNGLFTAPEEVVFTDMTDTLIDLQQVGQKIQNATGGGEVNMEDIEAQLEEMKNDTPAETMPADAVPQ